VSRVDPSLADVLNARKRRKEKMPQTIHCGIKALLDEANAQIETLSIADAIAAAKTDDVLIVDIRDLREIERDGRIPGSFSCTRGMLELWIDPASPYAKPVFQQDKKFIFHCAAGLRSALAAKAPQDMGLKPVAHIAGGFAAWRDAGGPTEKCQPRSKDQWVRGVAAAPHL
jgi:rhodanese-related sulfurtransferase